MASAKEFTDVIECPICSETYTDPRVLPCGHTCCFKCISECRGNRQPGQSMPCPFCRQEFTTLPSELPKNYSVMNVLGKMKESGSAGYCDQHADEKIKIYCIDCKTAICTMCFIASHNGHKCSAINSYSANIHKQMDNDVAKVTSGMDKCREILERVEREKTDFLDRLEINEVEIYKKAEQLKQMIDDRRQKLMNELSSMKDKRMKEIESLREEIERQLLSMESYKKYVDEVRQKGTACDIARAASGLHDRADELLKSDVIERTLADLGHADVTFTPSNYVIDDVKKTLGCLRLNISKTAVKLTTPTLTHVIPSQGGYSVTAVTSLGDDVFVAHLFDRQVEVYDAVTLTLQRRLTVPELGQWPSGLAACPVNNCLYAADCGHACVHRVELSGSNAVKKWSMARGPRGLSVNSEHNLIVACYGANKLQEYTTHGSLVREICLQAGVTDPYHAIQLSTGDCVVSQWTTSPGVVSVVGVDGQVVRSYGQSQTSDVGQIKNPTSLAVTKNDDILVADECNDRILSINSSLGSIQELVMSVGGGIHRPRGLCLDESRGRLYVGEYGGEYRVLVFDGVCV